MGASAADVMEMTCLLACLAAYFAGLLTSAAVRRVRQYIDEHRDHF